MPLFLVLLGRDEQQLLPPSPPRGPNLNKRYCQKRSPHLRELLTNFFWGGLQCVIPPPPRWGADILPH